MATAISSGAQATDTWRHGHDKAKGDAGIKFMAAEFPEEFGVQMETVEFASSTLLVKALLAGEIDSYSTTPLVAIPAMSKGAKIRFVGCDWPGMTYDLYAKGDIKTLQDLKGRSIGVSGPGSAPDLFAREALRSAGIDPSEATFANAGGGGDRFRAVVAGIVDATATSSEFEPEAKKRGINIVARAADATPNLLRDCIVTTEDAINNRHELLVRFLATQMVGYQYALDHPEETHALAIKAAKLKADDPAPEFIFNEVIKDNAVTPDLAIPAEKLQWNVDMMKTNGRIEQTFDVTAFIDGSLREEALKLVDSKKQ